MVALILASFGILGFMIIGLTMFAVVHQGNKVVTRLSPAEEAAFEIDFDRPLITAENVAEIVNSTIELGVDHPLLAATKRRSIMSRAHDYASTPRLVPQAVSMPAQIECDSCSCPMDLVSIEEGYSCQNPDCLLHMELA